MEFQAFYIKERLLFKIQVHEKKFLRTMAPYHGEVQVLASLLLVESRFGGRLLLRLDILLSIHNMPLPSALEHCCMPSNTPVSDALEGRGGFSFSKCVV